MEAIAVSFSKPINTSSKAASVLLLLRLWRDWCWAKIQHHRT